MDVVPVSCSLAQVYAVLVYTLQKTGTRIGALDEIIAATALGTEGKIVTRDSHFLSCPGLEVIHY